MPQSKTYKNALTNQDTLIYKNTLLAELALKLKKHELAFRLFTQLSEDTTLKKAPSLYSSVLFDLGTCHVIFERYDVAYVQFMKANTVCPDARWAPFATENAAFCIQELEKILEKALGKKSEEELKSALREGGVLEHFRKNVKAYSNTDNFLSLAYYAYHSETVYKKKLAKELKLAEEFIKLDSKEPDPVETAHKKAIDFALQTSYFYLNHAFKLNPNDAIVLQFMGSLHQEMNKRDIRDWKKNEDVLFALADYFREEKQPHKAPKIYHDWFEIIEKKRLAEGKRVSMLTLLILEAECFDEMGQPQQAIEVLRRQDMLSSTSSDSNSKHIQQRQKTLDDAAIEALDTIKTRQQVAPEVRKTIQASLTQWKSHPNIRPGTGYLRFFTPEASNKDESIEQCHPPHQK